MKFEKIESLFAKLLEATMPALSSYEQEEVQRFVDAGEYGLALEKTAAVYVEEKKFVSLEVIDLMKCLALAMSIDPSKLLSDKRK